MTVGAGSRWSEWVVSAGGLPSLFPGPGESDLEIFSGVQIVEVRAFVQRGFGEAKVRPEWQDARPCRPGKDWRMREAGFPGVLE